MMSRSASAGIEASAITRLPRVMIVFIAECFLSVSVLPDSMNRG